MRNDDFKDSTKLNVTQRLSGDGHNIDMSNEEGGIRPRGLLGRGGCLLEDIPALA